LGRVSDEVLEEEFARAQAMIFPGLEDFGITPVEAMAAGMPVIAYKAGGALDFIKPGVTGEFFDAQSVTSLAKTLRTFHSDRYSSAAIRAYAQRFSKETFASQMKNFALKHLSERQTK
jgi:glycosyltransferase involved in cell wall biosynthesis